MLGSESHWGTGEAITSTWTCYRNANLENQLTSISLLGPSLSNSYQPSICFNLTLKRGEALPTLEARLSSLEGIELNKNTDSTTPVDHLYIFVIGETEILLNTRLDSVFATLDSYEPIKPVATYTDLISQAKSLVEKVLAERLATITFFPPDEPNTMLGSRWTAGKGSTRTNYRNANLKNQLTSISLLGPSLRSSYQPSICFNLTLKRGEALSTLEARLSSIEGIKLDKDISLTTPVDYLYIFVIRETEILLNTRLDSVFATLDSYEPIKPVAAFKDLISQAKSLIEKVITESPASNLHAPATFSATSFWPLADKNTTSEAVKGTPSLPG